MKLAPHPPEPGEPVIAIRSKPPSPKRLSGKVLMTGSLLVGSTIAIALVAGLSDMPKKRDAAAETAVAASSGPPDSFLQAQGGYDARDFGFTEEAKPTAADASKSDLGPPQDRVWGGARGPAQHTDTETPPRSASPPPPDPEAVARASAILFRTKDVDQANSSDDETQLSAKLTPPSSRYALQAGQVIPAALVTALNADLPGRVIAQVTAPVYDSVSGEHLLIPQGSRLIGTYQSGARYGDRRVLLSWNRLILPNGWSISLKGMEATDASGASGLTDRTDNHLDRLAAAIALSSIISVVANEAKDGQSRGLSQSVGDAAAQQAAETGARIVDRELAVRPTLRVREGAPVRVLVSRDITLRPYRGPTP